MSEGMAGRTKCRTIITIIIIINLFRLHKLTMVLMLKRKKNKNIVMNYIYIIKPGEIKNKRTAGTRVNFMG